MLESINKEWQQDYYFNPANTVKKKHYRVEGQRAIRILMQAGDELEIVSIDQRQDCELLVFNKDNELSPQLLSSEDPVNSSLIKKQVEQSTSASSLLSLQFEMWNIDLNHLQVLHLSGSKTHNLIARESISVVIAAAGENMVVDQHNPTTEISVCLNLFQPLAEVLPEPLAEIKSEFRISKATARCYEVKKGEWIQIIDVSGKQCSDFLAFDQHALKQGLEVGLDNVATKTFSSLSNPQPGLHSKILASDMKPMLEVVQDTVGRHDSFMTACSAKYYEDNGYFGHINCSDNFNRALSSYAVKPRSAWPAINFFFNTGIDEHGGIYMDEPWSQAGDYVLLQAQRDLVCASSACPDDIDAANGWIPTDIHIRIYSEEHFFPRAIAHRVSPEELPRMTKTSGFHSRTSALTKRMIEYNGYWVAAEYEAWGATAEYYACRQNVALLDLSPLRKFEITGPDAIEFLHYVLTQNVRRMAIGQIAHSAICLETGGMIDDGTLFRMGENAFRWICGESHTGNWMINKAQQKGFKVNIRNSTDQLHNLAVQGPNSRALLSAVVSTPVNQPSLDNLSWFHFLIGRIADGIPIMVSRTGYSGELGYEVWCHPEHAEAVWDIIWQEGQQYKIAPLGFDAVDMLRIEAGFSLAGYEYNTELTPFEAGTGFSVPLKSKLEDFIGRKALSRQSIESRHKLVGLLLEDNEPAAHGDPVFVGRYSVGIITSATYSPLLGKHIALCRVAPEYANPGNHLQVGKLDGYKKRLNAEVVTLPFYDPKRSRVLS